MSLDGQALGQVNIDATGKVTLRWRQRAATAPAQYTLAAQTPNQILARYEVTGGGGSTPLMGNLYVTLAWTDPPAQPAAEARCWSTT